MSQALKAIVAMYALQNGAGCSGGNENLSCALTDSLKVGGQCSKQHVDLVGAWFVAGVPKMGGYPDFRYKGTFENICYKMPDSATFQQTWDIIRVKRNGTSVLVDAHGGWMAREKSGSFRYVTEYEIGEQSVTVMSHKKLGARTAK